VTHRADYAHSHYRREAKSVENQTSSGDVFIRRVRRVRGEDARGKEKRKEKEKDKLQE